MDEFIERAEESRVSRIGITSLLRDDGSSHELGHSFDVGSIVTYDPAEEENVTTTIRYDNEDFTDLKPDTLATPSGTVATFLEKVRQKGSIEYNLNPYFMVYSTGEVIPNFFTFAPKELWKKSFSETPKLSEAEQDLVVNRMIESARENDPDSYTLDRAMAIRMWDHRNHLHVSETGYNLK